MNQNCHTQSDISEIVMFDYHGGWLLKGANHLIVIFTRMGLSDKDIVAFSGGHTLVYLPKPQTINITSLIMFGRFLKKRKIVRLLVKYRRKEHIKTDQALTAHGQRTPSSLTILTLCKRRIVSPIYSNA